MSNEIEVLKAIYAEKQQAYNRLTDAYTQAMCAANEIHAMCDAAMSEMHEVGEKLLRAMEDSGH